MQQSELQGCLPRSGHPLGFPEGALSAVGVWKAQPSLCPWLWGCLISLALAGDKSLGNQQQNMALG